MKAIGIIPARYASTRFPGKPLIDINGKSMIQRVYEQASSCKELSDVYVATDDKRIFEHVNKFGGNVVMTSIEHRSGTERCHEAIKKIAEPTNKETIIVNIQGDEPFMEPDQISLLISCFQDDNKIQIATLIKKIEQTDELFNPNIVKTIINKNDQAIYFSRQSIPHFRGEEENAWLLKFDYFKHIGIYAYRLEILKEITQLKPSPLEIAESLEQLRWLENGYNIHTKITSVENIAIDTPDDIKKISPKI